jgi:starch phosphorylase
LRRKVTLPGDVLWIRAWEAKVGRRKLYLLVTNDPANRPAYRAITSELYGGGPELRVTQEAVLGIGGWRLLRALHIRPEVSHMNEGHAAFAVLEGARSFMEDNAQPFEVALTVTRAGSVFTAHSPMTAAFDQFSPEMMENRGVSIEEKSMFDPLAGKQIGCYILERLRLGHGPGKSIQPAD